MKSKLLFIFLFLITSTTFANTIIVPGNQFNIDHANRLIVTNLDVVYINTTYSSNKISVSLDVLYDFASPVSTIELGFGYSIINSINNKIYTLYFSQLPLISITTDFEIQDSPSVLAEFKLIEPDQSEFVSFIGIQYRGAWSQSLPKKSFEIDFYEDETGEESQDVSLLGMNEDDGWNLQAMYNEPLRIRSKTNNELWKLIHTPHYKSHEPDAISGIRMEYAELFLNGDYRGIYCVGEKVNRKKLKLKKYNGEIRGELYKGDTWGASTYTALPSYNNNLELWGGFELKYPNEITDWANIHGFVNFVMNSNNDFFYANYQSKFNIDNAVDYFIFLNLLRATDNTGKNLYVAKYTSNEKYFFVPWDLDGSFGTIWNGTQENITNDLLTNGFYTRLWRDCSANGFREKLQDRWNELRNSLLTHTEIMDLFMTNHNTLIENGIYEREHIAWSEYNSDLTHLNYMSQWLTNRLTYLDGKFNGLCDPLNIQKEEGDFFKVLIHPNPTSDFINFTSLSQVKLSINIYNSLGKSVYTTNVDKDNSIMSISHLENGIYNLKINSSEVEQTIRIIILK